MFLLKYAIMEKCCPPSLEFRRKLTSVSMIFVPLEYCWNRCRRNESVKPLEHVNAYAGIYGLLVTGCDTVSTKDGGKSTSYSSISACVGFRVNSREQLNNLQRLQINVNQ